MKLLLTSTFEHEGLKITMRRPQYALAARLQTSLMEFFDETPEQPKRKDGESDDEWNARAKVAGRHALACQAQAIARMPADDVRDAFGLIVEIRGSDGSMVEADGVGAIDTGEQLLRVADVDLVTALVAHAATLLRLRADQGEASESPSTSTPDAPPVVECGGSPVASIGAEAGT